MKNLFSSLNLIRFGLLVGAVAIIILVLPRTGHQSSYSYDLNQPWKYHLLTAEFDIPVYRDAATTARLKDSINRNFVPFVKRDDAVATANVKRFHALAQEHAAPEDVTLVTRMLAEAYGRGILEQSVYDSVTSRHQTSLRTIHDNITNDASTAKTIELGDMRSPVEAFRHIDSLYSQARGGKKMSGDIGKALNITLIPNVTLDTPIDYRFRSNEYAAVNAAQGVIKKGQRIVDLGEIVTPQIYTNLNTYERMIKEQHMDQKQTFYSLGQVLLITLVFVIFYLYLFNFRKDYFSSPRVLSFLMIVILVVILLAIFMFESVSYGIYLVPFAAVPILVIVFLDSRTAAVALTATVLISAMMATFQYQFILMEIMAGIVTTFSLRQLSKRSQLLMTAIYVFVVYCVCYTISLLLETGNLENFSTRIIGMLGVNCVLLSFAYFLVVLVEKIFGFTSTVTLVELSDINNKLLRRLAEEAPGTFQHSMQVSTLAAEAARSIGANVQMVRTGALYHDIGKLSSPIFFTENQHGVNPHDGLTPQASAHKIISHVTLGLQLAAKEKLPGVIRSFIAEHHGKGLTKYFYTIAHNENPNVDIKDFQYPGPNPQTKETTLLMMADAVEAASRSLTDFSEVSISNLVDRIIDGQIADGLYADSTLSFHDITRVKQTFKSRLATIYHSRIAYPEDRNKPQAPVPVPVPVPALPPVEKPEQNAENADNKE